MQDTSAISKTRGRVAADKKRRGRQASTPNQRAKTMKKEMLINVSQPEECRIAIMEENRLEELYIERASQDNYVGNIYKGRVVNLEPSIQAAFVDFGVGRNGFLHISDVEPQYFRQGGYDPEDLKEEENNQGNGRRRRPRTGGRPRVKPPIQEIFKRLVKCFPFWYLLSHSEGKFSCINPF